MAFSAPQDTLAYFGNKRFVSGTYTNSGGDTGGEVVTGLSTVEKFWMQPIGAAVIANAPVANETFPLSNATGSVTIVNTANESGLWFALGL